MPHENTAPLFHISLTVKKGTAKLFAPTQLKVSVSLGHRYHWDHSSCKVLLQGLSVSGTGGDPNWLE